MIGNISKNNLMDGPDKSSEEAIKQHLNVHSVKDKLETTKTIFEELSLLAELNLKK